MSLRAYPERARISAYKFGVLMANNGLGFDFLNISRWEVKTKEFEIKTDGTEKDSAEGLKVLAEMLAKSSASNLVQTPKLATICLRDAIDEYELTLAKTKQVEKSKKMAMSSSWANTGRFFRYFKSYLCQHLGKSEKICHSRKVGSTG